MNKIIQVPFTGRWTKIGDTYERSGRIIVAGANMFDILLLVSQWSFRHCLQMGSVGLWHISGELNMWTPGRTTSVNGKETKTSDNVFEDTMVTFHWMSFVFGIDFSLDYTFELSSRSYCQSVRQYLGHPCGVNWIHRHRWFWSQHRRELNRPFRQDCRH